MSFQKWLLFTSSLGYRLARISAPLTGPSHPVTPEHGVGQSWRWALLSNSWESSFRAHTHCCQQTVLHRGAHGCDRVDQTLGDSPSGKTIKAATFKLCFQQEKAMHGDQSVPSPSAQVTPEAPAWTLEPLSHCSEDYGHLQRGYPGRSVPGAADAGGRLGTKHRGRQSTAQAGPRLQKHSWVRTPPRHSLHHPRDILEPEITEHHRQKGSASL